MARGGSVELHHYRILCQSVSLLLGCKVWSSFDSYVGLRFPVHLLHLDLSLPFSGYLSLNYYKLSPPE